MSSPNSNVDAEPPSPRTELVSGPPASAVADGQGTLAGALAEEMATAWRQGNYLAPETFLERHREIADNRDAVLRLVCEELCLRQELGRAIAAEELLPRFPRWRSEVQALLDCHQLLAASEQVPFDLKGLEDFEVLAELGKGAQGSVLLARQRSLADRPVVLKITSLHGQEHLSLARLQHTHIVPLYWAQDEPRSERRLLCMPYFGNLTLSGLINALRHKLAALRTGQDILEVLDRTLRQVPVSLAGQGPARPYLARASYVQAVCWMGALLADALQYAHERGLVHLDIKPSNILLAGDGQPMLLDFHLAREPVRPDGARPRGLGGTPAYMAPEQSEVLHALLSNKPLPRAVDGRADLFSLGLVLYQVLGGPVSLPRLRLQTCNPAVPLGLADIIHKCLAERPEDRYADAASLAGDLRRHWADQKLRGVRNRSWKERWTKWRRRRPSTFPVLLIIAGLTALLGGAGYLMYSSQHAQRHERLLRVEQTLQDGRTQLQKADFAGAISAFERGLELVEQLSGSETQRQALAAARLEAQHRQLLRKLHDLTDQIRFAGSAATTTPERKTALVRDARALWSVRDRLLKLEEKGLEGRGQLWTDLRDLALWIYVHSGEGDHAILREAEAALGQSRALSWLGGQERQPPPPPQALSTASELQAVGWILWQRGQTKEASDYFDRAAELTPDNFWATFYQGACALHERDLPKALAAFRVCVALKPADPNGYYNLALVHQARKDWRAARDSAERALQLQPGYEPARELLTTLQKP